MGSALAAPPSTRATAAAAAARNFRMNMSSQTFRTSTAFPSTRPLFAAPGTWSADRLIRPVFCHRRGFASPESPVSSGLGCCQGRRNGATIAPWESRSTAGAAVTREDAAMGDTAAREARCAVIVGPYTAGKTTLLEAMLFAAGAIQRKGNVPQGTTVGDASPEARQRQMTTDPNVVHFSYLGDPWAAIDCPGSVELLQETRTALMAADICIVVAEPDPVRAPALAPLLRALDELAIPHVIFVNKIEKAPARIRDLLAALQGASARPLVLREVPIREGDSITGYVDLVSERAWQFNENRPSDLVAMPDSMKDRESEARQELLEALADFDDGLMEQLLEDKVPQTAEVYKQLTRDLQQDLIVPVFIGSAEHGNGIVRLLKALRHEAHVLCVD
eukprot:Opistho-2@27410